ncbi:hypothetical protein [Companilactobacillus paralimentarius]
MVQTNNVGKQISDVMNNLDNWKRDKHVHRTEERPNGTRGYIRK